MGPPSGADGEGKVGTVGKLIWTTLIDAFPDLANAVTSLRGDDHGKMLLAEVGIGERRPGISAYRLHRRPLRGVPHSFLFRVTGDGLIDNIVAYWDNVGWKRQLGSLEVD